VPAGAAYFGKGIAKELETKDIFLFSQAIAFKVLVTVVPVLVLATGIIGQVLRRDRPFEVVEGVVRDLLPGGQSEAILTFLRDLQGASGTITIVGVVGILISAITLLTTLRAVVRSTFAEVYREPRGILEGYLFDARMVVQVGLLFLLSMGITVGSQWLSGVGADVIRWYDWDWEWLFRGWSVLFSTIGLVLPLFVTTAMFAQLYFFVPRPRPPRRSVVRGALVAAFLWEIAKYAFTVYATHVAGFDLGSTFGLILAFGFWIYYSGLVFCIGALIALIDEKRLIASGHELRPGEPTQKPPPGAKLSHPPMPLEPDEADAPADAQPPGAPDADVPPPPTGEPPPVRPTRRNAPQST
jgi:membrane protein